MFGFLCFTLFTGTAGRGGGWWGEGDALGSLAATASWTTGPQRQCRARGCRWAPVWTSFFLLGCLWCRRRAANDAGFLPGGGPRVARGAATHAPARAATPFRPVRGHHRRHQPVTPVERAPSLSGARRHAPHRRPCAPAAGRHPPPALRPHSTPPPPLSHLSTSRLTLTPPPLSTSLARPVLPVYPVLASMGPPSPATPGCHHRDAPSHRDNLRPRKMSVL